MSQPVKSGTLEIVRECVQLLEPRDRRRLWLLTLLQMSLGFLDLLGIAIIGFITLRVVGNGSSGGSVAPSGIIESALQPMEDAGVASPAMLLLLAAGLLVVRSVLSLVLARWTLIFLANRQLGITKRLTMGVFRQDLFGVQRRTSQETAYALMSGVQQVTLGIMAPASAALAEISLITILGAGLLLFNWGVTLGVIVYFALIATVMHRLSARLATRLGLRAQNADIRSLRVLQDGLATYREATVLGRRRQVALEFVKVRGDVSRLQADQGSLALLPRYVLEVALILGAVVLGVTQFATTSAGAALVTVTVFFTAGSRILPSIVRLQSAGLAIHGASAMAVRTLDLHRELGPRQLEAVDARLDAGGIRSGGFTAGITLSNVTVQYPGSRQPALRNINLNIAPGSFVAVAGPSGSGKTTLADTILGVIPPQTGTVAISGLPPLAAFESWPGRVAYVSQASSLITGSLLENVCFALDSDSIDRERVGQVLEIAQLSRVVDERGGDLESDIGEAGLKFSGGERQRLALARALYSSPALVVLDEATSALDSVTEQAIVHALEELRGSITLVVIAHRLSTIKHADSVVYMRDAEVRGVGTFEELQAAFPDFERQVVLSGSKDMHIESERS